MGVVKKTLQKAMESGQDTELALLCVRTRPLGPGIPSPAELLFGRKIQSNLPVVTVKEKGEIWEKVKESREKHHAKYDLHSKQLPKLQPGQNVRIQNPATKKSKLNQEHNTEETEDTSEQWAKSFILEHKPQ